MHYKFCNVCYFVLHICFHLAFFVVYDMYVCRLWHVCVDSVDYNVLTVLDVLQISYQTDMTSSTSVSTTVRRFFKDTLALWYMTFSWFSVVYWRYDAYVWMNCYNVASVLCIPVVKDHFTHAAANKQSCVQAEIIVFCPFAFLLSLNILSVCFAEFQKHVFFL